MNEQTCYKCRHEHHIPDWYPEAELRLKKRMEGIPQMHMTRHKEFVGIMNETKSSGNGIASMGLLAIHTSMDVSALQVEMVTVKTDVKSLGLKIDNLITAQTQATNTQRFFARIFGITGVVVLGIVMLFLVFGGHRSPGISLHQNAGDGSNNNRASVTSTDNSTNRAELDVGTAKK